MVKTLRFLFVAALAMMFGNVMADTDVTFTFNTTDGITELNIALPAAGQGTKVESIDKNGVNIAATTAAGKTDTRVYQGSGKNAGKYDFRIYADGTLTFSAGSNSIKKIAFTGANLDKLSGDDYSAATDNKSGSWEGDAESVTLKATGTATIYTIVVTYGTGSDTRTATSIEFTSTPVTKATCGKDPSVALPSYQIKAGETPIDAVVAWSVEKTSGNDKLDGFTFSENTITIPNGAYGTLKVTASFAGDAQNKPSSKFYTLTVYKGYMRLAEFVNDYAKENSSIDATGFPASFWSVTMDETINFTDVTVTYVSGYYTYINDGTNDLLLYGNNLGLKKGDVLTSNLGEGKFGGIYGTIKNYNGLLEFVVDKVADFEFIKKSEGATITPKTLDIANISDLSNMNAYLKVENAEYVSVSSDNKVFNFKVGETALNVRNQFAAEVTFEVGAKYTIEGMGAIYVKSGSDPVYQLYYVASEKTAESGIAAVKAAKADGAMFNMAGQQVAKDYKGLVIMNGKKFVNK